MPAFSSLLVMEMSVDGLREAQAGMLAEIAKLKDGKPGAMASALGVLYRYALPITPVDTGRLKSSIFQEVLDGGERGVLATNVTYAKYPEFGTSRQPSHHFFGRAVSGAGGAAVKAYKSALLGE